MVQPFRFRLGQFCIADGELERPFSIALEPHSLNPMLLSLSCNIIEKTLKLFNINVNVIDSYSMIKKLVVLLAGTGLMLMVASLIWAIEL